VAHLLGYARVSTAEQNADLQVDELTAAGLAAAGLAAARARGRKGGRPSKLDAEQVWQGRRMYDERELTVEQIGRVLGVSRTSIYRALGKQAGATGSADNGSAGDGSAVPVAPGRAPGPAAPEPAASGGGNRQSVPGGSR